MMKPTPRLGVIMVVTLGSFMPHPEFTSCISGKEYRINQCWSEVRKYWFWFIYGKVKWTKPLFPM
jgi:hypothetical protein